MRSDTSRAFARDEVLFVCSVLVGSVTGLVVRLLLADAAGGARAESIALAVATTFTGATHARLVHRRRLGSLVPVVVVGVPLAYAVMRGIHALLGA